MTTEIEEMKLRHFESLQNLVNQKLDVKIEGLSRELQLTAAIVEAIGELEQGLPRSAMQTLKKAVRAK